MCYLLGTAGCGGVVTTLMKLPLLGSSTQASSSAASELSAGVTAALEATACQQWTLHTLHFTSPPPKKNKETIHLDCSLSQVRGSRMSGPKTSRLKELQLLGQCSRCRITEQGTVPVFFNRLRIQREVVQSPRPVTSPIPVFPAG